MKVNIRQEEFHKCLALVNRIIVNRGQLPVLSNVLIEAESDGVYLSGTNLEVGLRFFVGGKVDKKGSLTVPAKNLSEFVANLAPEKITLESDGEKLTVTSDKSKTVFTGIAASEFPVIPRIDTNKEGLMELPIEMVQKISKEVAFAAATDESRPVLTGVVLEKREKGTLITATDGFRLSRLQVSSWGDFSLAGKRIIVPAKTLLELARLGSDYGKKKILVEFVENSNQVVFALETVQLVSRLLEGNYPDVDKIIPVEYKTTISIDREGLLRAVRAVAVFARDSANVVKLNFESGVLNVLAAASGTGESQMEVEAEIDGEPGEMAFNFRYLLDYLGSIDVQRVILKSNGNLAPGVFETDKDSTQIHLIMPVRI